MVIPKERIKEFSHVAIYDGFTYDVRRINKKKKTITLGDIEDHFTVKLSEITEIKPLANC